MVCGESSDGSGGGGETASRWLHQDTTMFQVQQEQNARIAAAAAAAGKEAAAEEWRFELRVRYLPTDLSDLYERDKTTFCCYYDQVGEL
jgi:focal adhesion kinase 1